MNTADPSTAARSPALTHPVDGLESLFRYRPPVWKRTVDILGAVCGVVCLSPLLGLLATLIKLVSPGPVFFKQQRLGVQGRPFGFIKFRTMHENVSTSIHQQHLSDLIDSEQPMQKLDLEKDPRIIPCGRFIRQACLDELPQLFNVLLGGMSLVGPRPCLLYEAQEYLPWQTRRFDVSPGMTGLWQVTGKNKTTFKEMIRLDISYVKDLSLWLDCTILLRTFSVVISQVRELKGRRRQTG